MHRNWFWNHLVDAIFVRSVLKFLLNQRRDRHDFRLIFSLNAHRCEQFTNASHCLIAINVRHPQLRQYQGEAQRLSISKTFLYLVDTLKAILRIHCVLISILEPKYHEKTINDVRVSYLVVDDKNFPLRHHFFAIEIRELELDSLCGLFLNTIF